MVTMRDEAMIIERVFREVGAEARIIPPPASFQTTKARVYYLAIPPGGNIGKALAAEEMINQRLTVQRGSETIVRFQRYPLRLEVPRPDPTALPLQPVLHQLARKGAGDPYLLLGEGYNFDHIALPGEQRRARPVLINLADSATPHVLVAGTTGSGKTKLLQSMLLGMGVMSSPDQIALIMLDPKGRDFRAFGKLPHLAYPVVQEPREAIAVLAALVEELDARQARAAAAPADLTANDLARRIGPHLLVVVDELAELVQVAGDQVETSLRRLLQVGRGLRMHCVLATQYPTAEFTGRLARDKVNLPVRVVGKVSQPEDAKISTGLAGSKVGAHQLVTADFVLVLNGRIRRFHACALSDDYLPKAVGGIARLWAGQAAPWQLQFKRPPVSVPVTRDAPADRKAEFVQIIAQRIQQEGKRPSIHALVTEYQERYGKGLNYYTAKGLLAQAEKLLPS